MLQHVGVLGITGWANWCHRPLDDVHNRPLDDVHESGGSSH